ncbi:MAG: LamG-like jellyroll fold domain-containing protein [Bacilli bacterium]|jgi:prepilin-type N-terminal cleavage/methylation domain-containing protein
MNQRAFTLIELLAVIVIIGVISLITIPVVTRLITENKMDVFKTHEKALETAAESYMSVNQNKLPEMIDETTEVTLQELINTGFIKPMTSPNNKKKQCSGYVLVTKEKENIYVYTPHLNCIEDFGNAEDDGLVLHYKFDDFQEPTENIFDDLGLVAIRELTYIYIGEEDGWLKYGISGVGNDDTYPYRFTIKPMIIHSDYPTSVSFKYKTNVGEKFYSFGDPRMVNIRYKDGFKKTEIDKEAYKEVTIENISPLETLAGVPIEGESHQPIYFLSRPKEGEVFNPETDYIYFKDVQVEIKPYSTSYTKGVRTGVVKDYSSKGNSSLLQLNTTPRWVVDSKIGEGAYEFNGINSYIDTNNPFNFTKEGSFSISFWINSEDHSHKEGVAAGIVGKGHWYDNTWDISLSNTNQIRFECSGNPTRSGIIAIFSPELSLRKWHYYTATYDKGIIRIYLDGVFTSTMTYNGTGDFNGNRNVRIGIRHTDISRVFNGKLDDVRIYNRALSDEEVMFMYERYK